MSSEYQVVIREGKPYLRRKRRSNESPRQLVHRARFAKVAYDLYDKAKGYKNGLPIVAAAIKEKTEGTTVPRPRKVLELTPIQYAELLMQVEELRLKGVKVDLLQLLREKNVRIKTVPEPEIMV